MDISDISFHCIDEASENEADEELNNIGISGEYTFVV